MLTKSLSRAEYNREKKIITPKVLQRVGSQVPFRSHMLEATESMANQIRRYIENEKSQESHLISSYLAIEPSLHELQIKLQDLNRVLANREDEITYLKNEKQKNEKKIQNLDKLIFDLKTQTQKVQYEYKNTIDFLKSQNSAQKAQYLERIAFLEDESKKFKDQYENLLKSARQVYEFRINSFSETKETYKLASQEVVKGLKKDISFHVRQYDRLKEEISLNGKSIVDKLQYYEEENYRLKQKLTEKQLEFGFFLMNNSTEIKVKDALIQNLHKQFEEMLKNFQCQREKFISQKDNIENVRNEKEMTLNRTIENVLTQKRALESQLHENQLQINEIRYQNELLHRRCIQFSTKLQISELDKKTATEKLEKEIQLLKNDSQQKLEREMSLLKRAHEQKINFFKNEIEEKNHEITCLEDKISFLKKETETKNSNLKNFEESQRKCFAKIQQKESQIENLKLQIQKLKKQNELIRSGFQKEKRELKEETQKQKQSQIETITKKFNIKVDNLNRKVIELNIRQNSQNDHLSLNISRRKDTHKNGSNFDERLSQIPESHSQIQEEEMLPQQMSKTIQKQGQALLKNEETINALHLDLYKIKSQKIQKQIVIRNLQKELKELQKEFGKVKNEAIKRYTELKQNSEEVYSKLDVENSKNVVKLQTALHQIEALQQKIQHLQSDYTNLQTENQSNLTQNAKFKEAIMKNQLNSYELIERLETERTQGLTKTLENMKIENQRLHSIHKKNKESFNMLQQKYTVMAQNLKKKEDQIEALEKKQKESAKQILDLEGRIKSKQHIIQLLDQRLDDQSEQMFKTETAKLQLEKQKKQLVDKLSSYELYSLQLRKLKIYSIKEIQQILGENKLLKTELEEKKMEVQYQSKLGKDLQRQIAEMQRQYENTREQIEVQTTRNIMGQCRAKLQKEAEELAEKYRIEHQTLFQRNAYLEEEIQRKETQLKKANNKLYQSQQNVKQECEKFNILQRKIEMYKKQLQKVHKQLEESKSLVQMKQRLIITLKSGLEERQRKENVLERQLGLKKQSQIIGNETQRINRQRQESLSPLQKIKQFRRLVDYFDEERDKKYNSLSQKHRKIVDQLTKIYGYIRDLSTQGLLEQIQVLLKQITRLKSHKSRLIDLFIKIQGENKSKARKFSRIMAQIKESYKEFAVLDKQVQQQVEKWSTIIVSTVEFKKEQNPFSSSDNEFNQSAQSETIEQKIRTAVDNKYFSKQILQENILHVNYAYDFDFQDDTIRKQNSKEEVEETVQKKVSKANVRYGIKDEKRE